MKDVAVIIPIYKGSLNKLEEISLNQIHSILENYDVIYIEPEGLGYKDSYEAEVKNFPSSFFASVNSYNRLLLSREFYQSFSDYKYILICQLDVFIFSDKLKLFCDMGYDYYGAPWLYGTPLNAGRGLRLRFVGNGGLSLRNVQKTIELLNCYETYAKNYKENEDYFFSYFASKNYRLAPSDISRKFSIESHVRRCMEMNKGEIPFGIHAWERYDFEFWKPYIEAYGYDLSCIDVMSGKEDEMIEKGMLRVISANVLRAFSDYKCRRNN